MSASHDSSSAAAVVAPPRGWPRTTSTSGSISSSTRLHSISTPWFSSTTISVAPAARAPATAPRSSAGAPPRGAGDRRVHVGGHPRAGHLVVLAPSRYVLPAGHTADPLHVDRDEDLHRCSPLVFAHGPGASLARPARVRRGANTANASSPPTMGTDR